jgi:ABC-type uncharacterized transport system involved in gliding motility auxiliary subunit
MEGMNVTTGRQAKYGINTGVAILLFVGILILVNFVSNRHHLRTDLTEAGTFSLADQTLKILDGLERDVEVHAFFQVPDRRLEDLMTEYRLRSDHFDFEFVDPDRRPEVAKAYDVKKYGTVVVESGEKTEVLEDVTEEKLTNAILKVSREGKKKIYFLQGHDERDIDNIDRDGYNAAKQALESENYEVATLNLARAGEEGEEGGVPEDCATLVVASPKVDLFPHEVEQIEAYLEGGGSVLVMVDPAPAVGLESFLAGWGVDVGNNIVVDASGVGRLFGAGPTIPLVTDYPNHKITRGFNVMTFFPLARSVTPAKDASGADRPQTLLRTTPRSWGETNMDSESFRLNDGVDLRGPVSLAVAITRKTESAADSASEASGEDAARMVVVGDSDYACNSYFSVSGNRDLFLNIVNWLAEEEDLISIRPKQKEDRRVSMTAGETRFVFYLTVIALPLIVLGAGVVVKMRRR